MKRGLFYLLIAMILAVFTFSGLSYADDEKGYVEGEILVKFKKDIQEHTKQSKHKKHHAKRKKRFKNLDIEHVELPAGVSVEEAIAEYKADPDVEYAEPNYIMHVDQTFPDDPRFNELWGLYNTGQTGGTPGADIMAPEAWDITTGSSDVIVMVNDTGVDYTHEDLAANMWMNPNEAIGDANGDGFPGLQGVDDDGDGLIDEDSQGNQPGDQGYNNDLVNDDDENGYIDDIYGIYPYGETNDPRVGNCNHGTHVAGIIGAVGDNNTGVVGVNWHVKIMACKSGDGGAISLGAALECFEYARTMKDRGYNIVAINNSWGEGPITAYRSSLNDALGMIPDILTVFSAGNYGQDHDYIMSMVDSSAHNLPNYVEVTGTSNIDSLYPFDYGRRSVYVGAPGDAISTIPNNQYGQMGGTSMAAPHVTGLAALIKAQDPARDAVQIKNLILAGGDYIASLNDFTITGKRINAYGSLTCMDKSVFSVMKYPRYINVGEQRLLTALSINCESSHGPVFVTTSSGSVFELKDGGVEPDKEAQDGIFSAYWTASEEAEQLTFSNPSDSETIITPFLEFYTVTTQDGEVESPYSFVLNASGGLKPYTWEIISGNLPDGLDLDAQTGEIAGIPTTQGMYTFTVKVTELFGTSVSKQLKISIVAPNPWVRQRWSKVAASLRSEFGSDLAIDSNNDVIVTGYGNIYDGVFTYYIFVNKYDPSGNILWSEKYYLDEGVSVASNTVSVVSDSFNNIYVVAPLYPNSTYLYLKYNSSGELQWSQEIFHIYPRDMAVDSNDNVYVIWDQGLDKYDPDGNPLQTWNIGSSNFGVALDDNGDIYITALFYTSKYDSAGNLIWSTPNPSDMYGLAIAVDSDRNTFITGYRNTSSNYSIVKFDQDGVQQWARQYSGVKSIDISINYRGGVVITGAKGADYYVGMFGPDGSGIWSAEYNGGLTDTPYAVEVSELGHIYVTGSSYNGTDFDCVTVQYIEKIQMLTQTLPDGQEGQAYNAFISVTGGLPSYTWEIASGELPPGLTLNENTGEISGSPTTPGMYEFTVAVTNQTDRVEQIYTVNIYERLGILTTWLPSGAVGAEYRVKLEAYGGLPPYVWLQPDNLPPGLVFSDALGEISGWPLVAGDYDIQFHVVDGMSETASATLSLRIYEAIVLEEDLKIFDLGLGEEPAGLSVDDLGNIYIGGSSVTTWTQSDYLFLKKETDGSLKNAVYDGGGNESANDSAIDSQGNLYVTGGQLTVKYDTNGVVQRIIPFDGVAASIAVDSLDNIYVAGGWNNGSNADYIVIKYDTNGDQQGLPFIFDSGANDAANGVAIDQNGNVYVTGNMNDPAGKLLNTVKFYPTGEIAWVVPYDGTDGYSANDITVDTSGFVYVGGTRTTTENGNDWDFLLIKYNDSGEKIWHRYFDQSPWYDTIKGIAVDEAGNIYATGISSSGMYTGVDCLTVKFNADGDPVWSATYDSGYHEYGKDVAILPNGNILVTGMIDRSNIDIDIFLIEYAQIDKIEPLIITTDELPWETTGSNYSVTLGATGGVEPYAWSVYTGALPEGLGLNSSTGEISGVPTAAGSHDFTIRVGDAVGGHTDKEFVIDIYDPLKELDRYLPYGALGVPYDVELSVTGGNPPYTWSIAGGVLPQGIALDTGGGILAGTPTEIGIFPIAVEVMDGNGSTDTVDLVVGIFEELAVARDLISYDSGSYDYAQGVAADDWGNVYVAGMQYNGSDYDYVLIKYDASGGQVWKRTYDSGSYDYARDIALDTDGNIYLTGSSYNGADYDVHTIKYDQNGNIVWQATYDNGGQEFGYGVVVDPAGNVYVGGGEQNDFMTIKYDSAGTMVWKRTYDRGYENARDIAVDAGGNVYVTGESYQGTATDYLTVKYDGDGNELWAETYSGTVNDEDAAIGVALDSDGNVYVTGTLWGDTSLDYVTVKYDGDGTELWVQRTDMGLHDFAQGIAVDSEGSVYVTGFSYNGMNNDYHTVKYDSTGEIVWMQRYDGGTHEYGRAIALDAMGYVYVSGDFNNDMHTVKYAQLSGHTDLVMGPVEAVLEDYEITVTSRISNRGFNAAGGFYIAYYLSTDEVITQNDESVANLYVNGLQAGEDRVEQRTFQISSNLQSGAYYIGAIVDPYRYIEEDDERNNTAAGNQVTFTALPDLMISGQPVYTSYVAGAAYAMEYRIYNGSVQASGPFEAKLYLSTDSQVSGDDTEMASCSVPGIEGYGDYRCEVTATIPLIEAGSYYMITAADTGNSVSEINENNNTAWRSVSVTAGYPDLVVSTVSVEDQPILLGKITQVDFAVLNQEGADLAGNSRVCFYISDDETITASDILVGSAWIGGLASGQQYTGSVGIWTPWDADTGTQYIGAIADCDGQVLESSESNNALASAAMEFILLPDLRIYDLPRFTSYVIGEQYDLDIRTGNSSKGSAGSFDAALYLSPDSECDSEDLYLGDCTVPSIDGWSDYACTITWTVPAIETGRYCLCGITDSGNQVAEINENNNTRVYWNIVEVTAGYADLVVSSLVPGETSVMGDHNMDVAFTVRNDGADTAGASNIGFYLSLDGVITTDDIDTESGWSVPALGPGEEYTGTLSVWIPENVIGGTYYLGAIADNEDWVRESDEANNAGVAGQIDVITMDLVITGLTGSVYRDELTVDVRVKNKGNTAIEASQTGVYLSDDTSLDSWSDIYIGEIATPALGPGEETVIAQVAFQLPGSLEAGTYYFGAIADHLDLIDESNNWNNSALGGEIVYSPVDRPENISPADGEVVNTTTPTLTASAFVDVIHEGSHASSQWQVCGRSDCTADGMTAEISGTGSDVRKYPLPFTFPFYGREITDICVSTQGHVELLESGEVCYTEYNGSIHTERRHVGVMDVIFAAKDDLDITDGYTRVYDRGAHMMVEWYAVTYGDGNIMEHPLLFQVELHTDGTIRWNFDTMQFDNIYYDMYSGVYAKEEDTEIDAGYSINTRSSHEFDAQTQAVTETPFVWDVAETAFLDDTGEVEDLTSYTVPTEAGLAFGNTYHWRVRYKSSNNEWSDWSESTKMHVAEPLVITTSSLASGILGTWYSQTLASSGGFAPYSWVVYSGSLPDGLSLNGSTGEIAGTPTVAGTFTFTIGVSDAIESLTTREYTVIVDYPDADDDGYRSDVDCNDNDDFVYPGAPEIKHDGIDQDCNGYDLTIDITRAEYDPDRNRLDIRATSDYGSDAGLQVDGYGPMDWNSYRNRWELRVYDVYSQPATVTVSGPEGSATSAVTLDD